MQYLALAVFLAFSAAASYTDLKRREIPDWLNYSFLAAGILLSVYYGGTEALPGTLLAIVVWFGFSYAVYRAGAWAGGDVKFFSAMAPYAGLFGLGWLDCLAVFFASVILLLPVLGLVYWREVWALRREFLAIAKSALFPSFAGAVGSYAVVSIFGLAWSLSPGNWVVSAGLVLLFLLVRLPMLLSAAAFALCAAFFGLNPGLLAFLFAVSFAFSLLPRSFSILSSKVLRYDAKVGGLSEGDVPARTLILKSGKVVAVDPLDFKSALPKAVAALKAGKGIVAVAKGLFSGGPLRGRVLADAMSAGGLSKAQIAELKRAQVKWVCVKRTLAFAPVLAAGFLACAGFL
ncbi:MAG: prepilin peptidase [Candidatus Micrarchaeota archaeon]